ncbi:hypothetical protein KEM56_000520 [Ascosphaera pollenicola]|nr:hypothetical protein KEM56_000520 [Ascosphaera pollenicola]
MEDDFQSMCTNLEKVLLYLMNEQQTRQGHCKHKHEERPDWVLKVDIWHQLEILRQLLSTRPAVPDLPDPILQLVDQVLQYDSSHKLLTSSHDIVPSLTVRHSESSGATRISVWKGDITALTDVTAIANAANSKLLGCFNPQHRCIDNVIHSAAGPRLRNACYRLIADLDPAYEEPEGLARVTPGFNLPADHVLHTVGPQVSPNEPPGAREKETLARCYRSCLDATELLPASEDGRKAVAFCCISTGLFAFPSDLAAEIAVDTVIRWCLDHHETTITDVIFNTYLERDLKLYREHVEKLKTTHETSIAHDTSFSGLSFAPTIPQCMPLPVPSPNLDKAVSWLRDADYLLITAGAGLSAAAGLDYTSKDYFKEHFPACLRLGLHRLYDVIGYNDWPSNAHQWGFYYKHLHLVRTWPRADIYQKLLRFATSRFTNQTEKGDVEHKYFVRTSNADGLFAKNRFPEERISTPQGRYEYLQCIKKCRPGESVVPSAPYIEAALDHIDDSTQMLTDASKMPTCQFCGANMTMCIRGGNYYDQTPFKAQEERYSSFVNEVIRQMQSSKPRKAVILEVGVGMNTPPVIRWPDEELTAHGFRLIRAGVDAAAYVPWELEEGGVAVGINGDLSAIFDLILPE